MQDSTDGNNANARGASRRQNQTIQACDPCRVRKVRCQLSESSARNPAIVVQTTDDKSTREAAQLSIQRLPTLPCRRCSKLGLKCSFSLPVGRRGPKGPRNKSSLRTDSSEPLPSAQPPSPSQQYETHIASYTHGASSDLSQSLDLSSPEFQAMHERSYVLTPALTNSDHQPFPVANHEASLGQLTGIHHSVETPASVESHFSPNGVLLNLRYPTDDLCSRVLLRRIINDFLAHLYPLIPVVHRPTFRASLDGDRDVQDKQFLSMLLSICAVTVGVSSAKFREYQSAPTPLRFQTRLEMIDYCYALCVQLRGPRYFDQVSHRKWAIPYLLYLAYWHIGEHNKSRMIESEAILFARLLELHRLSAYSGLNCIETQLRKKAFWLMFYGYVHLQLQNHRKERLAFIDCSLLHDIDLESLLPATQDDEQVMETSYGPHDDAMPTLTTGFNLRSRLFWAAVKNDRASRQPSRATIHCHCTRLIDPASYMDHLHSRLHELKYMLDNAPWYLRQWGSISADSDSGGFSLWGSFQNRNTFQSQLATLRADIHTTHLWLQSIIMDQVDALLPIPNSLSPTTDDVTENKAKSDWFKREDICRQLLLLLCSIPEPSLEANGLHLVYKVRDVAVSLLACPFDEAEESIGSCGPATRAKEYLRDFTEKLRHLDKSETINSITLQTWIETDCNEDGNYYYW